VHVGREKVLAYIYLLSNNNQVIEGGYMNFSNLSAREKAAVTHRDLQKRKEIKEKGKQEATDHLFANTYRIQKAKRGIKRSKPAW
jgi:hypothetical protein